MTLQFPYNPYTRHRDTNIVDSDQWSRILYTTVYAGSVAEPWHIDSTDEIPGTFTMCSEQKTMDDVVTAGWHRKQAMGSIVNNPMESLYTAFQRGRGSQYISSIDRNGIAPDYFFTGIRQEGDQVIGNIHSSQTWALPSEPSPDDSVIAEALTEAWASVSLNEAEILVQVAEAHKTILGLISISRRILKIIRAVKKLDLAYLRKQVSYKELSNRYMELRYSLRPLYYDMLGLAKAGFASSQNKQSRKTFRSFRSSIVDSTSTNVLLKESLTGHWKTYGYMYAARTLEVRAGVLTALDKMTQPILMLGATEPIQAVWELIPFSFIVDWFCNVGKIIASWSPKVGFKTLASWYTVTDTCTLTSTAVPELCENTSGSNYESIFLRSGSYSKVTIRKYRLPNPERPLLPSIDLNIDVLKTFDLGIILKKLLASKLTTRELRL